jgi:hypothetical protein
MALEDNFDCCGCGLDQGCGVVSNEQVEREIDNFLNPGFDVRYREFMVNLKLNYPTTYRVLKVFGF